LLSRFSHRSERTHPAFFFSQTTTKCSIVFPPHQAEKTMEKTTPSRKHPCRICVKWFMPNPQLGDRQKTCGADACKQQWHAAKCAEWNRQNSAYFKEIYLRSRLEPPDNDAADPRPSPCSSSPSHANTAARGPSPLHLPREAIQEVMGTQQIVIIEYVVRVLLRGVQEVISTQHLEMPNEFRRLLAASSLRGDSQSAPPGVSSSC